MTPTLNVLLVEDCEDDAWMILREFKKNGLPVNGERVQSSAGLNDALNRKTWDIVVSDYRMPHFSGMTALAIVRVHSAVLPFILLSGVVEERVAKVAIMTGATAFLEKANIGQLISTIRREVKRAAELSGGSPH